MTASRNELRDLEGRQVSVTLTDGSRMETCSLVSAGRASVGTLWVFGDGADTFIPLHEVIDIRATAPPFGPVLAGTLPAPSTTCRGLSEISAREIGATTQ